MFEAVAFVVRVVVLVGIAIAIHEVGHYTAAAIAGIPARERRIIWLATPPHLALVDGDELVSPFENKRYSELYGQYDPERRHSVLFTGGGFLAQALVVAPAGVVVGGLHTPLGVSIVASSLGFAVVYLGIDLVATHRRGKPFGDATHLWRLDRLRAVGIVVLLLGTHLLALGWLIRGGA